MTGSAVVIGASGGIGRALADALEDEGQYEIVHRMSRSAKGAHHINLQDEASIAAAAERLVGSAAPSLILIATGLLHTDDRGPEKTMRDLDPEWLAQNFAVNAIGPSLVAKHFLPLMPRAGRTIFAALSARVGSIADNRLGGWYGYRASKAALNMTIRNLAIEHKRINDRAVIVGLHPGTVDTKLSQPLSEERLGQTAVRYRTGRVAIA